MLDEDKLKMIKDAIDIQYVDAEKVNVEEYGVITGTIYGSRRKDFVRIKSDVFQSLFKELKDNKNCSYITYANSVIREGFIPQRLSVLIKYLDNTRLCNTDSNEYISQEVLAAQLLNYYGINTCHNIVAHDKISDKYNLLSVDFVEPDTEFYTFDEMNYILGFNIDRDILYQLPALYHADEIKEVGKDQIDKICSQYVYSFLIRKLIFKDNDFSHTNCGILKHKDGTLDFINFDYEFCFDIIDFEDFGTFSDSKIEHILKTISKQYPDVLKEFIEKSKILLAGLNELRGKISCQLKEHAICLDNLTKNLQQVLNVVKIMEDKNLM